MRQTILVLNTGSSSVKASLICPPLASQSDKTHPSGDEENPANSCPFETIRIVTAHAEQLGTKYSTLHISISMTGADLVVKPPTKIKAIQKSHSLNHPSRATIKQSIGDPRQMEPDCHTPVIKTIVLEKPNISHKEAIEMIIDSTKDLKPELLKSVIAIGHRVVHGGENFSKATLVDEYVIKAIEEISHLAPLHNPSNLQGIRIAMDIFKNIPNVVVFDTAFHSTMPKYIHTYPIPKEYVQHHIRKYGFHGTSVKYVSQLAAETLQALRKNHDRLIVAHLGNGASVTAIVDGKSIDTSMEFTPLSGIMMGTRSGSVDPSIVIYASEQMGKTPAQVLDDLNRKSGLYGITGGHNDMRVVIERAQDGDKAAGLAIEIYVHTMAKHIAGLIISCGGSIDAIVFTAGVGENSPLIRQLVLEKLSNLIGLSIDDTRNKEHGANSGGIISIEDASSPVAMVLRTDEEIMISQECEHIVRNK